MNTAMCIGGPRAGEFASFDRTIFKAIQLCDYGHGDYLETTYYLEIYGTPFGDVLVWRHQSVKDSLDLMHLLLETYRKAHIPNDLTLRKE